MDICGDILKRESLPLDLARIIGKVEDYTCIELMLVDWAEYCSPRYEVHVCLTGHPGLCVMSSGNSFAESNVIYSELLEKIKKGNYRIDIINENFRINFLN